MKKSRTLQLRLSKHQEYCQVWSMLHLFFYMNTYTVVSMPGRAKYIIPKTSVRASLEFNLWENGTQGKDSGTQSVRISQNVALQRETAATLS